MKKAFKRVAALVWIGLLAPAMLAQNGVAAGSAAASADRPSSASVGQDSTEEYVIGADDVLHVTVWKETDLTETVPVRPDGKISMPLLGDVPAAGMSPTQLGDSIRDKLKKYIADPRVTVVVTAMNSRRVFVTGEVTHSGPIPMLPHMTVLQALSAAGFTQFANLKGIYLLRNENGRQVRIPFNYKDVVKGLHAEQNIQLKPGDTVVVP